MESNLQPSLIKSTATYGSILGVIIIIYSLFLYIFNVMPVGFIKPLALGLVSIIIYIVGVVIFAKKIRNNYYPNEFPFGTAFLTCFLIAVFAAVVSTLYSYIQSVLIDPEYYTRIMEAQKEYMANFFTNRGLPEDQLQSALDKIDESIQSYKPLSAALKSFLFSIIISAVVSLIIAAIIKRNVKIFDEKI